MYLNKKRKTIWNPEKPHTDFRLNKKLALAIRQLGASGLSSEDLLYKYLQCNSEVPTLRKKVREMPKHDKNGD